MGGDGLVVWWLGLQGEGRLVSRQSSAWIKSSFLWAVFGEKESHFLSVPALLFLSALRLTLVLGAWLHVCGWVSAAEEGFAVCPSCSGLTHFLPW